ncbi:MAG: hypothetical protein JNL09_01865 [Anaerolineales bacterium]|nr:hypothetical protein [Anaerolineales bacterium]
MLSWLWLLVILVPLILLERLIHRHLQGVWLLLFRDPDMAMILYSIIMLPGVALHEFSHWAMATILMTRTGRFSIFPQRLPDGTLRLGFVETQKTDIFREALIGAAPLIVGTLVILAISFGPLNVAAMGEALAVGDLGGVLEGLVAVTRMPDAWLWLYLLFVVSNSMLPSASDRRTWLPVLAVVAIAVGLLVYAGFSSVLLNVATGPLDATIRSLASAFTITVILDVFCLPPLLILERGLSRLTGLKVEY